MQPDGRILGLLSTVLASPANDVYVVGSGKTEILLPAIRDVVVEVDLGLKRIVVRPTPGLIPEELCATGPVESNET